MPTGCSICITFAFVQRGNDEASAKLWVEAVREAATERGIALVGLDVWSFNEGAHAFFRRQGFERMWSR
jgi:GNAT superfamily N-acetyltransferase